MADIVGTQPAKLAGVEQWAADNKADGGMELANLDMNIGKQRRNVIALGSAGSIAQISKDEAARGASKALY